MAKDKPITGGLRTSPAKLLKGAKDGTLTAQTGGYHTGNTDPAMRGHGDPDAHPER